jgi:uncharacterized phage protein gp47/JayE
MPDFDLDDLVEPVTRAEAQQSIYDVLGILGVNTTNWKSGAVVRTMIVGVSAMLSALSELQAQIARSGFLELSKGKWLTLVARYVYGKERCPATFATGEVSLSNAAGGIYSFDPDDLIFANPENGHTYRNTAAVAIGALAGARVAIQATEAGSDSSASVGAITEMVTVVLGLSCLNEAPLAGVDEESDAALRERCRDMLGALSPMGPWDAYGSAVRNAVRPDGSSLGITRIRILKDGYGTVTTYVADADGAVSSPDVAIAHDAILRNAEPLSVNAVTASAVSLPVPVTYEVWLYNTSAQTEQQIKDTIAAALEAFFTAQPIGGNVIGSDPGKIFVNALMSAIFESMPEVFRVAVTTPAADVELLAYNVAVPGSIVATRVNQEPPPQGFGGSL